MGVEGVHAWIDLHRPSLSETLADAGVDDIETATTIAADAHAAGKDIGEALVGAGVLTEGQWVAALATRFDLPVAQVDAKAADPEAIARVPEDTGPSP
jgi:type IV pilus assembly protein PilB